MIKSPGSPGRDGQFSVEIKLISRMPAGGKRGSGQGAPLGLAQADCLAWEMAAARDRQCRSMLASMASTGQGFEAK